MLSGRSLLLAHLPFRPQESVDRAIDKHSLGSHSTRPKGAFPREAELFEQTAGAVIACVCVGCDFRKLPIDSEGIGEHRSYRFSGELEAPVFFVDSVAEEGEPMPGTEDEADEADDTT